MNEPTEKRLEALRFASGMGFPHHDLTLEAARAYLAFLEDRDRASAITNTAQKAPAKKAVPKQRRPSRAK